MIITIWCITIVVISIVAVGAPVSWLLNNRRPLSEQDWIETPFLGIAVIILVLQNLVYLDVPVGRSTPFFWVSVLFLWIWFVRSGHVRASMAVANYWLFAVALAVYLIHGLGLILIGAQHYVGRAWLDQFNYNSIAQFLVHEHFSTPMSAIGHRPYLVPGITLKPYRIGQSVLHAFFAVSSLSDTKTLFEPTIILSAGLT